MLSWARVVVSSALAAKLGKIQTSAHHDDEFDHWQSYGFQSRPKAGADAVVVSIGSHADQRIAIMVGDRRWTFAIEEGEALIYDDLGQRFHLTRSGAVIAAPSIKLGASATLAAARATDPVALDVDFGTWAALVTSRLVASLPGGFAGVTPAGTGTITSGSAVTAVE